MNDGTKIIIAFIKARGGELERAVINEARNPWRAPEATAGNVQGIVLHALHEVTDDERAELDKMRGQGAVEWLEVARAFEKPSDEPAPVTRAAGGGNASSSPNASAHTVEGVHITNPTPLGLVPAHPRMAHERAAFVRICASNHDTLAPDRSFVLRITFERSSMLSPRKSLEVALPYEAKLEDLAEQLEHIAERVREEARNLYLW